MSRVYHANSFSMRTVMKYNGWVNIVALIKAGITYNTLIKIEIGKMTIQQ